MSTVRHGPLPREPATFASAVLEARRRSGMTVAARRLTARTEAEMARIGDDRSVRRGLLEQVAFVHAGGLCVLDFPWIRGTETVAHPVASMYSVDVTDEGPGHVRIRVGSTEGEVDLRWVARSRALLDVLGRWEGGSRRRAMGVARQDRRFQGGGRVSEFEPDRTTLPAAVVQARRALGISLPELATMADVPLPALAELEAGGATTPEVRASVRSALALVPPPVVRPRPVSSSHALVLRAAHDELLRGGTLLLPDLDAWAARTGWREGGTEEAERRAKRMGRMRALAAQAALWSSSLTLSLAAFWSRDVAYFGFAAQVAATAASGAVAAVAVPLFLLANVRRRRATRDAREGEVLDQARRHLVRQAHVLRDDEVVTCSYDSRTRRVVQARHLRSETYAIEVTDESDGVATVAMRGTRGRFEMRSVPAVPALVRLVHGWTAPDDSLPWTPSLERATPEGGGTDGGGAAG